MYLEYEKGEAEDGKRIIWLHCEDIERETSQVELN